MKLQLTITEAVTKWDLITALEETLKELKKGLGRSHQNKSNYKCGGFSMNLKDMKNYSYDLEISIEDPSVDEFETIYLPIDSIEPPREYWSKYMVGPTNDYARANGLEPPFRETNAVSIQSQEVLDKLPPSTITTSSS